MHIHRKFWFHFFSLSYALFELRNLMKMKDTTETIVSTTPLKPLNRIAWNVVVMKDIMFRYAFLQEMLIWSFWGAIYIPFFVRLPVPNAWNCHSLYTAFSGNVGAQGMWACSLFLSLKVFWARLNESTLELIKCPCNILQISLRLPAAGCHNKLGWGPENYSATHTCSKNCIWM